MMQSNLFSTLKQRQRDAILISLPIGVIGLFMVVYALLNAAWPPDYENATASRTVSHPDRLLGHDIPPELATSGIVQRPEAYQLRRILDALVYYGAFQAILSIIGLAWWTKRFFYVPLALSGFYGTLYAASLGSIIGPILTLFGFALVFWVGVLGWLTTTNGYAHERLHHLESAEA